MQQQKPQPQHVLFQENTSLGHYLIKKFLGGGSYADVYLAIDTATNNKVAVKCLPQQGIDNDKKRKGYFHTEVKLMSQNKSENCITLIGKLKDEKNYYLILEFCNDGDFEQYLKNNFPNNRMTETQAIPYFKAILNGVKSFHMKGIAHRDLKLENIFVHNGIPKIGDFGLTKQADQNLGGILETIIGTPITMAPELLKGEKYTINCDVYSLGAIFYEILFGKMVYDNVKTPYQLMQAIQQKSPVNYSYNDIQISDQMKALLQRMLEHDPTQRISIPEIWQHPFFSEEQDNDEVTITRLQNRRINAQENIDAYQAYEQETQKIQLQQQQQQQQPQQQQDQPIVVQQNGSQVSIEEVLQESNSQNQTMVQQQLQKYEEFVQIQENIDEEVKNLFKERNLIFMAEKCYQNIKNFPDNYIDVTQPTYYLAKKSIHLLKQFQERLDQYQIEHQYQQQLEKNQAYLGLKQEVKEKLEKMTIIFASYNQDQNDPNRDLYNDYTDMILLTTLNDFYYKIKERYDQYQEEFNKSHQKNDNVHRDIQIIIKKCMLYMTDTLSIVQLQGGDIGTFVLPDYEKLTFEQLNQIGDEKIPQFFF